MAYFGVIYFANMGGGGGQNSFHSAPKSQRFLRFAIVMPIVDPRNRSDFRDKRSTHYAALRLKGAMESR